MKTSFGVLRAALAGLMLVCCQAFGQVSSGLHDVTRYGAMGDGATLNTAAIQSAIDACAAAGGGVVSFPAGKYLTGTIYLKSGVHLCVEQGATLLGSTNLADYPVNYCKYVSRSDEYTVRALIWGEELDDVGITGRGTIDGQGAVFRGKTAPEEELEKVNAPREAEGRYHVHARYLDRPYMIRLISCRHVRVEDISLRNSPMWMQHYLDCDFLTVRGINVYNHGSENNDMIDIDGCRNVIVSDCVGDSDDDALTFKSTGAKATEHVVVNNCILRSHCNAIKMGTESAGGFKDIAISNCVIQRSQSTPKENEYAGHIDGISGIALELVDGGSMARISISNIVIEGTSFPLFLRLGNRGRAPKPSDPKPAVGTMRDIAISNVVATGIGPMGSAFSGIPGHCIENVSLSNISIRFDGGQKAEGLSLDVPENEEKYPEGWMFGALPAYGFYFRHIRGLRLHNIQLAYDEPDNRPAIICDDVENLRLEGLQAQAQPNTATQVLLKDTRNALVTGCTAAATETFVTTTGKCEDIRLINNDTDKAKNPLANN